MAATSLVMSDTTTCSRREIKRWHELMSSFKADATDFLLLNSPMVLILSIPSRESTRLKSQFLTR